MKPHGIMFHHFFDDKHAKGQGAISAEQFESIIDNYQDVLLPAEDWYQKAISGALTDSDVCITFDDALLCQYEVALPILEKYKLSAFWFVYTSVINGEIELLELYRKFRLEFFDSIDHFYQAFFLEIDNSPHAEHISEQLINYSHADWEHFPFYSPNDTKFRFIRDTILTQSDYDAIMQSMIQHQQVDLSDLAQDLWMNKANLQYLHTNGHIVGLHSHTHPTALSRLSNVAQKKEYKDNFDAIYEIIGEYPKTVSHPCNSYNSHTLTVLESLGIKLGFRANMADHHHSMYEFPREDHANIVKKLAL